MQLRVQQRSRYEALDNQFRPNPGLSSHDVALALQTSLFVEAGRGRVRFFGELMDARQELNDEGSFLNTTMVNALEPLQAYASFSFADLLQDGSTSTLRAGRFTMDLGRRRFLARSGFRNSINSFAGLDWQWRGKDGRNARAFVFDPLRILPASRDELFDNEFELDRGNRDTHFAGLYYQTAALPSRDRLELYWYGLDQADRPNNDALPRDIDSAGFRVFRPSAKGQWSYEIETLWQTGVSSATAAGITRRDLEHDADFYHLEFGYAFEASWSPVLLFQYDGASGDEDPFDGRNDGFDTLYGERRFDFAPQGIYGAFARGNLRTPGLASDLEPQAALADDAELSEVRARRSARCLVRRRATRSDRPSGPVDRPATRRQRHVDRDSGPARGRNRFRASSRPADFSAKPAAPDSAAIRSTSTP